MRGRQFSGICRLHLLDLGVSEGIVSIISTHQLLGWRRVSSKVKDDWNVVAHLHAVVERYFDNLDPGLTLILA
jgi:hypothetical protein